MKNQYTTLRVIAMVAALLCASPSFGEGESVPVVRTITLAAPSESITRQFFGRVTARETVDLSFEVGGTLERLVPDEGTLVSRGDLLGQLELSGFERSVEQATLALDMARREAERAQTLASRQIGAAARAQDAATARDLAEVALRDAQAALADASLRAPFDGLVAVRMTPAYSAVAPGQPILKLHDMSEVRVEFALPEQVFQQAGDLADVRFSATLPAGRAWPLRLVSFQPATGRVGQSYTVTLAFDGQPPASILPGASVAVTATLPHQGQGMAIPATALLAGNDRGASVLAIVPMGGSLQLREMPVTVGSETGVGLAVEGLPPDTEIVATGVHLLRDGQIVRRFTGLTTAEN